MKQVYMMSLKIMQGTDTASKLVKNSTMADLRETNARMSRIEMENRLDLVMNVSIS